MIFYCVHSHCSKKEPSNNIKLIIIGDGTEKQSLENLNNELHLNKKTNFPGRIVNNVDHYFRLCDCFVLPGAEAWD